MSFHVPEPFRIVSLDGLYLGSAADGNNGLFLVTVKIGRQGTRQRLRVIASDHEGWEHVSVSRQDRCPTWEEMCAVKALFWDAEDTVMQLHVPQSEWVNNHPNCLHLWRPFHGLIEIPRPPSLMVGIKDIGTLT